MTDEMTVLVTGASGNLGTAVLPRLAREGHQVRPMSRSPRPGWVAADLRTGEGLAAAVAGADAIVHLASAPTHTRETDIEGTRRLLAEARTAGVRHVLFVSINGVDRVPLGYYRVKLAVEEIVRAGGVPFTILRAAQFPTLADTLLTTFSRLGPLIIDPRWRMQPVDVEDVADRIAELLTRPAAGETTEFAGPEVLGMEEMARRWLAARHSRRPIWRMRIPGRTSAAIRAGGLTTPASVTGTRTWEDYLAAKY
jgi:uncharacterized protein YbjT (DUF2867 family)